MPNKPPVAVLKLSKTEITLPENSVTLDGSESSDPNTGPKRGKINNYKFIQDDVVIQDSSQTSITVQNLKAGTRVFQLICRDLLGLESKPVSAELIVNPEPKTITIHGAHGGTVEDPDTLAFICGKGNSRFHTTLTRYGGNGHGKLEKFLEAGFPCFWNLNEKDVEKNAQGDKVPNPFPTDMDAYKKLITPPLKFYQGHPLQDKIHVLCENEPTTEAFHSGPMSDYGKMLKVFAQTAKELGYKNIGDGGVHILTILGANDPDGQGKGAQVAQLLDIYATIPELTRVTVHTNNINMNYFDIDSAPKAAIKCKSITGKDIWSNEWHVKPGSAPIVVNQIQESWELAGALFSTYITGTEPGSALNDGTNLTEFGKVYKAYIVKNTKQFAP